MLSIRTFQFYSWTQPRKKTDQKPEILHTFCFSGHLDPYCKAPGRSISSFFLQNLTSLFREDTHKFFFYFLVVGPVRFFPTYTNGLVVSHSLAARLKIPCSVMYSVHCKRAGNYETSYTVGAASQ